MSGHVLNSVNASVVYNGKVSGTLSLGINDHISINATVPEKGAISVGFEGKQGTNAIGLTLNTEGELAGTASGLIGDVQFKVVKSTDGTGSLHLEADRDLSNYQGDVILQKGSDAALLGASYYDKISGQTVEISTKSDASGVGLVYKVTGDDGTVYTIGGSTEGFKMGLSGKNADGSDTGQFNFNLGLDGSIKYEGQSGGVTGSSENHPEDVTKFNSFLGAMLEAVLPAYAEAGPLEGGRGFDDSLIKKLKVGFNTAELTRSPLVLDLDGDGVETLSETNGIYFDLDANGFSEHAGWAGKDDGLLVWDKDENGQIDDGSELFGDSTLTAAGTRADNGFLALADLDANKDGVFDVRDSAFSKLNVWVDRNSDGVVQDGELLTMEQAGVASINLSYADLGKLDANGDVPKSVLDSNGNQHRQTGSYTRTDGSVLAIDDVWFGVDGADTVDKSLVNISDEIKALPDLEGFGNVHSLQQAMASDTSGALELLVKAFANEADASKRQKIVVDIIYHWAGVEAVDPNGRAASQIYGNVIGDARKLATLEAFLGEDYLGTWCWGTRDPNPHGPAAAILLQSFDNLISAVYDKLMIQTHFATILGGLQISLTETGVSWDVSSIVSNLEAQYSEDQEAGIIAISELGRSLSGMSDFGASLIQQLQLSGISGGGDFDHLLASIATQSLIGGFGNDVINGTAQDDSLYGFAGNDRIYGGGGDDLLWGGVGDDYLAGGDGADTYEFTRGEGKDIIFNADQDAVNKKLDKLVFGAGILASDVVARRYYYDLILEIKGTSDSVTIQSYFDEDTVANHGYAVDQIVFSDGSFWAIEQVKVIVQQASDHDDSIWGDLSANTIDGKAGNDTLYGLAGDDNLAGGDGNDQIYGGDGDDILSGGDGNDAVNGDDGADYLSGGEGQDSLSGGAGTDTLLGGDGNDFLDGGAANDILVGGAGNDVLQGGLGSDTLLGGTGNDTLYGDEGDDTLDGGAGNDVLQGGLGSDTYVFGRGAGQDTIQNFSYNDPTPNKTDTIRLQGLSPDDVVFSRDASDLLISIKGTTDSVRVSSHFTTGNYNYAVDQIEFGDGGIWTSTQLRQALLNGDENANTLTGYASDDMLSGFGGNDVLDGLAGNDTLLGGTGNDTLYGDEGDDTLDGGAGNDVLQGGLGSDTYVFGRGAGQDTIQNFSYNDPTPNKTDTIRLQGLSPDDVVFSRDASDLLISIKGTTDSVRVSSHFTTGNYNYAVDQIEFGDGGIWTSTQLRQALLNGDENANTLTGYASDDMLSGFGGNDVLDGLAGNDTLLGGTGNDTLYGDEGDDTLDGGAGNDVLQGGLGSDTYVFGRGAGQDTIQNFSYNDPTPNKTDTIRLQGLSPDDVVFSRDASDLLISIKGTTDSVRVSSHFTTGNYNYAVDQIEFGDGGIWTSTQLRQALLNGDENANTLTGYASDDMLSGFGGNDVLDGLAGNDTLLGGTGNDTLYGDEGDDTLDGGAGNDVLQGGLGSDTYVFGRGAGQDTIQNFSYNDPTPNKTDTIRLQGLSPDDVVFSRDASDLLISIKGTTDSVRVSSHFTTGNYNYAVDQIEFGDGGIWTSTQLRQALLNGDENANTLTGYASDDMLSGFGGNDVLDGLAGNDTLLGGTGNDTLYGDEGDDTLDGGAGNDVLQGGLGSDTYVFGRGAGQDTIQNFSYNDPTPNKTDTIRLQGLSPDDVVFSRDASDLLISIKGTTDSVRVSSHFTTGNYNYAVDQIEFGDGGIWTSTQLRQALLNGDENANTLTGYASDDMLSGFGGNDVLDGLAGNDTLLGGTGNDTLYGDEGDDTLDGGAGNDVLQGGLGSDTYVFGRGAGQDTIQNFSYNDPTPNKTDTIRLQGLSPDDVVFSRDASDLLISIKGTTDSVRVSSHFTTGNYNYAVDQIEFGDGGIWTSTQLRQALLNGDENANTLTGYASDDMLSGFGGNDVLDGLAGNDTLLGGTGNDTLYGDEGDDVLDGGSGNDTLNGGEGNDTYLFDVGAGQDVISNYDSSSSIDTVQFGEHVSLEDLWFRRNAGDLEVSIVGTADKVIVSNWYASNDWHVDQFRTADGKTLLDSQVQSLVDSMASFGVDAGAESSLTSAQHSQLEVVLAASWK